MDVPVMEKDRLRQAVRVLFCLAIGYVGIYLCRKNLSVANPMLQEAFGASKADVGAIASWSTVAYMLGKFASGPVVDRFGGRAGFLMALAGVAFCGALGGLAPGIGALTLFYSANRFFGAAGWGSMMHLTATWVPPYRLGTAIAALSLSYVFGGMAATYFAQQVIRFHGDWRAVMAAPSLVVLLLIGLTVLMVRPGPLTEVPADVAEGGVPREEIPFREKLRSMLLRPQFLVACVLSFTLTLLREAFNTWSVDYLTTLQSGEQAIQAAALQSTAFDASGAVAIVLMGVTYDRLTPASRRRLMVGILLLLTGVLAALGLMGKPAPHVAMVMLAGVGLLSYGPYSILGGALAVESGGTELTGTATGIIDGIGYLAGILAGYSLGAVLDSGGYPAAFGLMAGLTLISSAVATQLGKGPALVAVVAPATPAQTSGAASR